MLCLLAGKYSNLPSFCSVASTAPRSSAGAFPPRDAVQNCSDIPLRFAWQTSDSFWERCAACVARGWWPTSKGLLQGVLLLNPNHLITFGGNRMSCTAESPLMRTLQEVLRCPLCRATQLRTIVAAGAKSINQCLRCSV